MKRVDSFSSCLPLLELEEAADLSSLRVQVMHLYRLLILSVLCLFLVQLLDHVVDIDDACVVKQDVMHLLPEFLLALFFYFGWTLQVRQDC
jgi:hypothetical protein